MGKGHWQRSQRADYAIQDVASDFILVLPSYRINNFRLLIWKCSVVLTLCLLLPSGLNLWASQVLVISINIVIIS